MLPTAKKSSNGQDRAANRNTSTDLNKDMRRIPEYAGDVVMTAVGKGLDKDLENSLTKLTNTIPAANLSEGNKVGKGPPPLRDKEQGMQRRGLHIEAQDIIKAAHTISRERWKALFSVLEVYHVHHGNFRVSYKDIVGGLELEVWIVNLQGDISANPE